MITEHRFLPVLPTTLELALNGALRRSCSGWQIQAGDSLRKIIGKDQTIRCAQFLKGPPSTCDDSFRCASLLNVASDHNFTFVRADEKKLFSLTVADPSQDKFVQAAPERFYRSRIQTQLFACLTQGGFLKRLGLLSPSSRCGPPRSTLVLVLHEEDPLLRVDDQQP